MTDLFLLRHADANTESETDDGRRLSEKGIGQAKKVARFIAEQELQPELIVCSPVRRAHETARIISDHLEIELITEGWLACGMHPEAGANELRGYDRFESVMIVGHEPDFSRLIAHLIGLADAEQIRIRKASLTHLQVAAFIPSGARLVFSVPCRLM